MRGQQGALMPVLLAFVAYLLGSLVLSALLLPLVYPGIDALFGDEAEPSGAMYRIAMFLMLLGFPWFLKRQRLLGWHEIGFTLPARPAWIAVFKGLGLGTAMLTGLALVLVLAGARVYVHAGMPPAGELLEALLGGLIGGLLVGLIEEAFFRGMMHTGMRRRLAFWPTALLTGAFYASVHFIRPAELPAGTELDLSASLSMLGQGLAGLFEFAAIHDSFISLLVAGVLLAMVRERTGNICWVIGIHAGWVLVVNVTKLLTDTDKTDGLPIWVGHYDKVTGWLAAIWLALVAGWYWYRTRSPREMPAPILSPETKRAGH
jgi:membrane protease YdiL (CAAX protease family)